MKYIRQTEEFAKEFLLQSGFTNVVNLNEIQHASYFDLKAEKDGKIYVAQVTTHYSLAKSYTTKRKRYCEALRLNPITVFVKPDMSLCLLKEGLVSLSLKDLVTSGLMNAS